MFQGNLTVAAAGTTILLVGNSTAVESPTCKVIVRGSFVLQPGTGTTGVILLVYRGIFPAGTLLGSAVTIQSGITAGANCQFIAEYVDTLTNAGQAQYSLAVQQASATGAGTAVAVYLQTTVLSG